MRGRNDGESLLSLSICWICSLTEKNELCAVFFGSWFSYCYLYTWE